mmetsp:Transcript_12994/g.30668  ORF Transcript_12994/g.30668 Transcript_12994/m.30668 type:complete len:83 (+) Transcript_12994:2149-2397(+)
MIWEVIWRLGMYEGAPRTISTTTTSAKVPADRLGHHGITESRVKHWECRKGVRFIDESCQMVAVFRDDIVEGFTEAKPHLRF